MTDMPVSCAICFWVNRASSRRCARRVLVLLISGRARARPSGMRGPYSQTAAPRLVRCVAASI